ncbi:MAG: hypothetical protein ACTSRZ_05305 [Promethearchaeota archaeon]
MAATDNEERIYKEKYLQLIRDIKKEFPNFAIINKGSSRFSKMLGRLVFWNKEFNTHYITTIGPKIFVHSGDINTDKSSTKKSANKIETPESGKAGRNLGWPKTSYKRKYAIMLHERIHIRQESRFGLIVWTLLYMLFPFPTKIAYLRKKWEQEAYEIDIYLALKEKGREYVLSEKFLNNILKQFCGTFYFYTWYSRKAIIKWVLKTIQKIEKGKLTWNMLINRRKLNKPSNFDVPKILKWIYPEDFK